MSECYWLPELFTCDDFSRYIEYENNLYKIYTSELIKGRLFFKGKPVTIRDYPLIDGKEEGFYHVICQDYNKNQDRNPDFRRCERIHWVRAFIENYLCRKSPLCTDSSCEGIVLLEEPKNSKHGFRYNLFFQEERYIVVLEPRKYYVLLITAFYYDNTPEHQRRFEEKVNLALENKKRLASETQSGTPSTTSR